MPAGNWKPWDLDSWWDFFTQSESNCNSYGMLLALNRHERPTNRTIANFSEIIPEFNKRNTPFDSKQMPASIFVTSGAYPQPGWGVLIELPKELQEEPSQFEELIGGVLNQSCSPKDLASIFAASEAYKGKDEIKNKRPTRFKLNDQEAQLHNNKKERLQLIFSILKKSEQGDFQEVIKLLDRAVNQIEGIDLSHAFSLVRSVQKIQITRTKDLEGFESLLKKYLTCEGEADYEQLLNSLSGREGGLLRNIKVIFPMATTTGKIDIETTLQASTLCIQQELTKIFSKPQLALKQEVEQTEGRLQLAGENYSNALKEYRNHLKVAEINLRTALVEASTNQWKCGPIFLKRLEDQARRERFPVRSLIWEPVRMIGWKLQCEFPELTTPDFLSAITTALGRTPDDIATAELSGSLFADYTYYVAPSIDKTTPRLATQRILESLLSVNQVRTALQKITSIEDLSILPLSLPDLVDQLITNWGWKNEELETGYPILRCIEPASKGTKRLCKDPNETRILLEGCFQDFVRVTFSKLGWSNERAIRQIGTHSPEYKFSQSEDWQAELEKMTLGASITLLKVFLPMAFPQHQRTIDEFISKLRPIREQLNSGSHYPPSEISEKERVQCGSQIDEILKLSNLIIDEFPWHFTPQQTLGRSPEIITGYAWSHSHAEERMIRILVQDRSSSNKDSLLVWNPSKINPVMPDAMIL